MVFLHKAQESCSFSIKGIDNIILYPYYFVLTDYYNVAVSAYVGSEEIETKDFFNFLLL